MGMIFIFTQDHTDDAREARVCSSPVAQYDSAGKLMVVLPK